MALAKFPRDLPKMMFERYWNVLLVSLWTSQLTIYFWPAELDYIILPRPQHGKC